MNLFLIPYYALLYIYYIIIIIIIIDLGVHIFQL